MVHLPPGLTHACSIVCSWARVSWSRSHSGRQAGVGRQLLRQREQGVSEVVTMATWMLTKAREAVSSHSALLRSPGLISQAGSRLSLGSTGRRAAPGSRRRTAVPPDLVFQPRASPARTSPGWPPSPAPASQKSTSSSRNWESELHLRESWRVRGWGGRVGVTGRGVHLRGFLFSRREGSLCLGALTCAECPELAWACLQVYRCAKASWASVCMG